VEGLSEQGCVVFFKEKWKKNNGKFQFSYKCSFSLYSLQRTEKLVDAFKTGFGCADFCKNIGDPYY